jgi:hypothetical protein
MRDAAEVVWQDAIAILMCGPLGVTCHSGKLGVNDSSGGTRGQLVGGTVEVQVADC